MPKFARKSDSFAVPDGHVRLVPTENGYAIHFLPRAYVGQEHVLVGMAIKRGTRWGWTPWHGRYQLPDVNRLREAVDAVVTAAVAAMVSVEVARKRGAETPTEHPDHGNDFGQDTTCMTCSGRGEIVTCIDDMCHGQEECIHGDGYEVCPDCGGHGHA